ncbi:MAG: hypothetical protein OXK74_16930 [Gemmatimonadota bacterium]|nr:hypothetical protein [Gemmatimonadota bacterium]
MLAAIAFALQAPNNGVAEAVAMSMVGPDCIFCDDDEDCPDGQHEAWEAHMFPNFTRNGGVHISKPCFPGSCWTKHGPACGPGGGPLRMVDMDRLRGSIEAKDVHAVKDLLANHTQSAALNVERSAVQVMDCEGAVIAHFPVDQKFLDRVSAE